MISSSSVCVLLCWTEGVPHHSLLSSCLPVASLFIYSLSRLPVLGERICRVLSRPLNPENKLPFCVQIILPFGHLCSSVPHLSQILLRLCSLLFVTVSHIPALTLSQISCLFHVPLWNILSTFHISYACCLAPRAGAFLKGGDLCFLSDTLRAGNMPFLYGTRLRELEWGLC